MNIKQSLTTTVLIIALFALVSCGGPKKVFIDNPTKSEITVKVGDNESIILAPETTKSIELPAGEFEISLNEKIIGTINRTKNDVNAVINPTKSIYINDYVSYEEKQGATPESVFPKGKIEYLGNTLEGDFDSSDDLYINFNSDYSLEEKFPEQLTTYSAGGKLGKLANLVGDDYEVKTKVSRIKNYILDYNDISEEELDAMITEYTNSNANKEKEVVDEKADDTKAKTDSATKEIGEVSSDEK